MAAIRLGTALALAAATIVTANSVSASASLSSFAERAEPGVVTEAPSIRAEGQVQDSAIGMREIPAVSLGEATVTWAPQERPSLIGLIAAGLGCIGFIRLRREP